jgi:hypothetical protein
MLEEAVVDLVGGQVRHAVRDVRKGLWVEQWFALLIEATANRVRDELVLGNAGWEGPWRLLHGLAAVGSPALAASATTGPVQSAGRRPKSASASAGASSNTELSSSGSVGQSRYTLTVDTKT